MPLRPLAEEDLARVLEWRNAPEVRRNMYTKHEISWAEHQAWFSRIQQDPESRWYIYEDSDSQPKGVVCFTSYKPASGSAFWGFYSGRDAGPGIGTKMEIEALEIAFTELRLHKLNCEVLATNTKVINLHQKFGFRQEGRFREFHFDGEGYIDVVRLGILKREWADSRDAMQSRLKDYTERQG